MTKIIPVITESGIKKVLSRVSAGNNVTLSATPTGLKINALITVEGGGITEASADAKYLTEVSASSAFIAVNKPGVYTISANAFDGFKVSSQTSITLVGQNLVSFGTGTTGSVSVSDTDIFLTTGQTVNIEATDGVGSSINIGTNTGEAINIGTAFSPVTINLVTYPVIGADPGQMLAVSPGGASGILEWVNYFTEASAVSQFAPRSFNTTISANTSLSAQLNYRAFFVSGARTLTIQNDGWKPGMRFEVIALTSGVRIVAGAGITIHFSGSAAVPTLDEPYVGATFVARTSTTFYGIGNFG